MKQFVPRIAVLLAFGAFVPDAAFAATRKEVLGTPPTLELVVSLVGLGLAVTLLLEALALRKVALGGAITERISYVFLAIVCLAGSAIAEWTQNFVADVTLEQVRLASQLLVIAAMGLLAAYFYSVRKAFQGYLKAMTGSASVPQASPAESDEGDDRLA